MVLEDWVRRLPALSVLLLHDNCISWDQKVPDRTVMSMIAVGLDRQVKPYDALTMMRIRASV